ncbi:MAG: hypothetical protein M0P58_04450 [Bacteroidales bacterium]|nr:hypothetical protein [Bacteroidales bacterium]
MKKQLLLFILVIFSGFTTVFGQTCTDGPLAPAAGTPYNYTATISGAGYDGAGPFTWYVTKDVNLLSGVFVPNDGAEIIASGAGAYNTPNNGANTITIEWTSQAIANNVPYYLVIKYSQANSTANPSCTAMNMKVWEIRPINKFLLAVNPFSGAVGQDGIYCAADITGAVVNAGASTVSYTYGSNIIYAEITASKYTGAWTPSFKITGNDAVQTIESVSWDTDPAGAYANTTTPGAGAGEFVSVNNATAAYDGSAKIYAKIVLNNNSFETLADLPIAVAVDGVIPVASGSPLPDVISDADCTPEAVFGKNTTLTIKARPTITPGVGTFMTKNP